MNVAKLLVVAHTLSYIREFTLGRNPTTVMSVEEQLMPGRNLSWLLGLGPTVNGAELNGHFMCLPSPRPSSLKY
uniref:Uncharacterized protein n=1 Tax=Cebus imitator TaxID=2715852 RepID=A0A2K5QF14_CEBIM